MSIGWFLFLFSVVLVTAGHPVFKETYEEVILKPYRESVMECYASGEKEMEYYWFDPYSREIGSDWRNSVYSTYTLDRSYLHIENPGPQHNGSYTCSAVNKLGRASKIFEAFFIEGFPTFKPRIENILLTPYIRTLVNCQTYQGEEPMTYTWIRFTFDEINNFPNTRNEGEEVGPDQDNSVYTLPSHNGLHLVFNEPAPVENQTYYICVAKNKYGEDYKLFNFSIPSENITVKDVGILNITDSSVTFSVSTTQVSHNIYIRYTEDQEKEYHNRTIETYGETELIVEFSDLVPAGRYRFEFQARSSNETYADWSKDVTVVLLPSAPEVIFLSMKDRSIKIKWVKKFAEISRKTILDYSITYGSVYMRGGDNWESGKCITTVTIPSCGSDSYAISDLSMTGYYEFQVKARTISGFGNPSKFKISVQ